MIKKHTSSRRVASRAPASAAAAADVAVGCTRGLLIIAYKHWYSKKQRKKCTTESLTVTTSVDSSINDSRVESSFVKFVQR
jgi:hypothetical protein